MPTAGPVGVDTTAAAVPRRVNNSAAVVASGANGVPSDRHQPIGEEGAMSLRGPVGKSEGYYSAGVALRTHRSEGEKVQKAKLGLSNRL